MIPRTLAAEELAEGPSYRADDEEHEGDAEERGGLDPREDEEDEPREQERADEPLHNGGLPQLLGLRYRGDDERGWR